MKILGIVSPIIKLLIDSHRTLWLLNRTVLFNISHTQTHSCELRMIPKFLRNIMYPSF